jgi:glycosyltransferase involved in cell wall biosynthesis
VHCGKKGWLVDELMDRIHGHRELGHRLHLHENPSDGEITDLYDGAAGLLFVSLGEGFGLPLVEAANHGIPILCSDLPVFREICGDYATYISGREPPKVADQIAAWWSRRQAGQVPATGSMPRLTWEQSSQWLLDVIVNEKWIY